MAALMAGSSTTKSLTSIGPIGRPLGSGAVGFGSVQPSSNAKQRAPNMSPKRLQFWRHCMTDAERIEVVINARFSKAGHDRPTAAVPCILGFLRRERQSFRPQGRGPTVARHVAGEVQFASFARSRQAAF